MARRRGFDIKTGTKGVRKSVALKNARKGCSATGGVFKPISIEEFMGKAWQDMDDNVKKCMQEKWHEKVHKKTHTKLRRIKEKFPNLVEKCRKNLKKGDWKEFRSYIRENSQDAENSIVFVRQFKESFEKNQNGTAHTKEEEKRSQAVQEDIIDFVREYLPCITQSIKTKTDGMLATHMERMRVLALMEKVNAQMKKQQGEKHISQQNQEQWALRLLNCLWQPEDDVPDTRQLLSTWVSEEEGDDMEDSTEEGEGAGPA